MQKKQLADIVDNLTNSVKLKANSADGVGTELNDAETRGLVGLYLKRNGSRIVDEILGGALMVVPAAA